MAKISVVTDLQRTERGWTAKVDGLPVHIRDGNAYWMRSVYTGGSLPLTAGQQGALDQAAYLEAFGLAL